MGSTRSNLTYVAWVEFFLTHHGELGQKIPSIRPNPTHAYPYYQKIAQSRVHCSSIDFLVFSTETFTYTYILLAPPRVFNLNV